MPARPFLLYAYPWMPYPRRVIIYLREKGIPASLVTVVPVSDPQAGNTVPPQFPPKPEGSLPLLAIPASQQSNDSALAYTYISQSLAIMTYLDDLCDAGQDGFPQSPYSMRGADALSRARDNELMSVASECLALWYPVRLFGSGLGSMSIPAASKESARWIHRQLATIEAWWKDRDMTSVAQITMAEIMLYAFLEFCDDVYGRDLTRESMGTEKDVYDREAVKEYPKLAEFYAAFELRESARRNAATGEEPADTIKGKGWQWMEGSI